MITDGQTDARHPIQVVVRRTGLKPDLIRAWERRYRAVEPRRSSSGRRVYTDRDVARLLLLRQAILGGRRIGDIAHMGEEELQTLVAEDRQAFEDRESTVSSSGPVSVRDLMEALRRFDNRGFETLLRRAEEASPPSEYLQELVVPLMREVGEAGQKGQIRIYHEHLATALVRRRLESMLDDLRPENTAWPIIVTTPAAQIHELGALMASVIANARGWDATYLGVNMPAEEIAAASTAISARAIALSLVHPPDDPGVVNEVRKLRRIVAPEVPILLGGRALRSYAPRLDVAGLLKLRSLGEFERVLDGLRRG